MKVILICGFPPAKDNLKAPTALPYQILKYAPENIEIDLYYFPLWYKTEKSQETLLEELNLLRLKKIYKLQRPNRLIQKYINWRNRKQDLPGGVTLFPIEQQAINQINASKADVIWLYPHWLINWITYLKSKKIVVSGMDCSVLHSERMLRYGGWSTIDEVTSEVHNLRQNTNLEKLLGKKPVKVHMVGIEDVSKYEFISGTRGQAYFVPHPHSDYVPLQNKLTQTQGKITVLFSGGGHTVYVGTHLEQIIKSLVDASETLASRFQFLFIGNDYEVFQQKLISSGYFAEHFNWVENYSKAISKAQIQIFPIAVGSGTKGKVLNALATGLLGIGSKFAFENISVQPGEDCIMYTEPEEVSLYLLNILNNLSIYEKMADSACIKVRLEHSPEKTSEIFWSKLFS
ncbi:MULTISPECIES: hypothetical protein [Nostocales]|uniref:Glycosyltransferase n=3 Tax=Nostocales TaxID=1161 RepID=A0A8S9T5C3_9CYAN|nr:hypothetical protein [Tolypothrix bouteillei]KAF3886894.1 hypothetical protein DA73_0400016420 [Tolypothrix bouteillei VB521301]